MKNDNEQANALFCISEWHIAKCEMLKKAIELEGDIELRAENGESVTLIGRDANMFRQGLRLGLIHFAKLPVDMEFDDCVEGDEYSDCGVVAPRKEVSDEQ